jgi:hypothetical protein
MKPTDGRPGPEASSVSSSAAAEREARLAKALRDNLRRRKAADRPAPERNSDR